ncbi:MAG TPA: hypothetical protein PKE12_08835 [Kiritimatiellia bacterium]|nr:hypothetical protein [Kiritimatiellia bacterium]
MSNTPGTQTSAGLAGQAWFAHAGTALTIAAGLAFLVVCMVLPLVGKAGVQTAHADRNHHAFLAVLLVSLVLSVAATVAKLARRHIDHSPAPHLSITLTALNLLLLVALLGGLLSI